MLFFNSYSNFQSIKTSFKISFPFFPKNKITLPHIHALRDEIWQFQKSESIDQIQNTIKSTSAIISTSTSSRIKISNSDTTTSPQP